MRVHTGQRGLWDHPIPLPSRLSVVIIFTASPKGGPTFSPVDLNITAEPNQEAEKAGGVEGDVTNNNSFTPLSSTVLPALSLTPCRSQLTIGGQKPCSAKFGSWDVRNLQLPAIEVQRVSGCGNPGSFPTPSVFLSFASLLLFPGIR
ncbi:hypothetical protein N7468_005227 [Penicillium chermesinum]|uniref:Uncharacterized protein n=1 Tax=Penicillium chermesinum TaxID=63820 RepID=A0A9W9NZ42_9EURO|nr:uncharacterized protein N7468_005227 [Penicillium chermesinum]KAJ5232271.1 hypothetical protein N7468_005227 [Penicillium chermesinum]